MGFKKMKDNNEIVNFIESARGETTLKKSGRKKIEDKDKRKNYTMIYFTDEEMAKVKKSASERGLTINAYVRFKIFDLG